MRLALILLTAAVLSARGAATVNETNAASKVCTLRPLGAGQDDTDQVEAAIARCGHFGRTVFQPGEYNITRKMTWDLVSSRVDLHGFLSFKPDIDYWLNANNTYRVIFIQDQASWFVVTGHDFWSYYATHTRLDGDGRPVAFTLSNVTRGLVKDFRIEAQPFWCNAVADSREVTYDGMYCNATNQDPTYVGQNIVPNTDGIDTYRSDKVMLLRWDITTGDDCLAIKGNSTNVVAKDITCHGGNGLAFGSLGQYVQFNDIVDNVIIEDVKMIRLPSQVQPNMRSGVYFKTWTGAVNGSPPTGGGGGGGFVSNVVIRNVSLDRVSLPIQITQTNAGHLSDAPSTLQLSNLTFIDFSGTSEGSLLVDLECSSAAPCPNMRFDNISIGVDGGATPSYKCVNVVSETGLSGCHVTGTA